MTKDDTKTDRRGFFSLSWLRAKEGSVDALKAVGKASRNFRDAMAGLDADDDADVSISERRRRAAAAGRVRGPRAPAARGVIRPPGAIEESAFLTTCQACHACVEACPEDAIEVARPEEGRAGRPGTPLLRVHLRPCVMCTDVPCANACPSGALRPLSPDAIALGSAVVFKDLCLVSHGEPCSICSDTCPVDGALAVDRQGYPEVKESRCTGCGLCVSHCPTYPAALHVVPG